MRRFAVAVTLWMLAAPALAGISVPGEVERDKPVVAVVQMEGIPEGAKMRGSIQVTDAEYLDGPNPNEYHIWGGPGEHQIIATGVWVQTEDVDVGDGKVVPVLVDFGQYRYTASFTVKGGDDPNPPIPPTPTSDIATKVLQLYGQVSGATKQREAKTLSEMYSKLAEEIESASDPLSDTTLVTPAAALQRQSDAASALLGDRREAWDPWFSGLAPFMTKLFEDGKLPRNVFGVGKAFEEISKGLAAAK